MTTSKIDNLSVALAVYNEAGNLDRCLESVTGWAREIVIVDGGSSDRTLEIAASFGAEVIKTTNPPIFHINKQKALAACKYEWILQLDADEVVTRELKREISILISKTPKENGFYIPRKNYFLGSWLRKGGQYPNYLIRLVRRDFAYFPCKSVHEQIVVKGKLGYLVQPLKHYSFPTLAESWQKADRYAGLTAQEYYDANKGKLNLGLVFRATMLSGIGTFLSLLLRHKGFIDGLPGFLFAVLSGLHFPLSIVKYLKLIQEKSSKFQ